MRQPLQSAVRLVFNVAYPGKDVQAKKWAEVCSSIQTWRFMRPFISESHGCSDTRPVTLSRKDSKARIGVSSS
jgi:hypothetical protein